MHANSKRRIVVGAVTGFSVLLESDYMYPAHKDTLPAECNRLMVGRELWATRGLGAGRAPHRASAAGVQVTRPPAIARPHGRPPAPEDYARNRDQSRLNVSLYPFGSQHRYQSASYIVQGVAQRHMHNVGGPRFSKPFKEKYMCGKITSINVSHFPCINR